MAEMFFENGALGGEELRERIPLRNWITKAYENYSELTDIYQFLLEAGSCFSNAPRLTCYPNGVIAPYKVEHLQCHANNILYAAVLSENQPKVLNDLQFVSGFFGMKAKKDYPVPIGREYFIGHHSFMTYKGALLDCTMLQHPPRAYDIDQYFGIAFDLNTVVRKYDILMEEGVEIPKVIVLEALRNEPYLK